MLAQSFSAFPDICRSLILVLPLSAVWHLPVWCRSVRVAGCGRLRAVRRRGTRRDRWSCLCMRRTPTVWGVWRGRCWLWHRDVCERRCTWLLGVRGWGCRWLLLERSAVGLHLSLRCLLPVAVVVDVGSAIQAYDASYLFRFARWQSEQDEHGGEHGADEHVASVAAVG